MIGNIRIDNVGEVELQSIRVGFTTQGTPLLCMIDGSTVSCSIYVSVSSWYACYEW